MGKDIILLIFCILIMIPVVYAPKYDWIFNPYTSKLDRSLSPNQTGYNLTADYCFCSLNGSFAEIDPVCNPRVNSLNDTKVDAFSCPGQLVQNASSHSVQCVDFPIQISYYSDEIYINQINHNFTLNESKHNDSIDAKIASKDLINSSYGNSTYCFANGTNISGMDCTDLIGYAQYNYGSNNFNGSGNYTTTGNISALKIIGINLTVTSISNLSGFIICTNASGIPKLADALGYARAKADGRC